MKKLIIVLFACNSLYAQQIAQDKQRHFATSVAISSMSYISAYDYFYVKDPLTAERKARVAAAGIALSAGVVKEIYDFTLHRRANTWTDATRKDAYGDLLANLLAVATVNVTIRIFTK